MHVLLFGSLGTGDGRETALSRRDCDWGKELDSGSEDWSDSDDD